jgi:hypothetical protein
MELAYCIRLKLKVAIVPPGQEGWMRGQEENVGVATLFRADGVVDPANL